MSSTDKYTVVVDALQMLCVGKIAALHDTGTEIILDDNIISVDKITLHRNRKLSHPGFNSCFSIHLNSEVICRMFYGNSSKYRYAHQDVCQINIENHVLYQSGWLDKITTVLKIL